MLFIKGVKIRDPLARLEERGSGEASPSSRSEYCEFERRRRVSV